MQNIFILLIIFSFTFCTEKIYTDDEIEGRLVQHESESNKFAKSVKNAKGHYQITPICLKEYNRLNKVKFTHDDMFVPWKGRIVYKFSIKRLHNHHYKHIEVEWLRWICVLNSYNAGQNRTNEGRWQQSYLKIIIPEYYKKWLKYYGSTWKPRALVLAKIK